MQKNSLIIHLTVTTMDAGLARILEPRAPRPDLRIEAVKKLNESGIPAAVICAPVLPEITDSVANLEELMKAASTAGAKYLYANPLFLKPCSAKMFLPFLAEHFPHLVERYKKRFQDNAYVSAAYRKRLCRLMDALARKYGMPDGEARWNRRKDAASSSMRSGPQMRLFA